MVFASKSRAGVAVALLGALGMITFGLTPAYAAPAAPLVTITGEVVQVADQQGPGFAAIRLADNALVPINAVSVKGIRSGSAVTLDVVIPAAVRSAAAANRPLTAHGVDGKQIAVPLRSSDLAAASDGSPEGLASAIGKATVAAAMAPGTPPLEVSNVVTAAADPVSTQVEITDLVLKGSRAIAVYCSGQTISQAEEKVERIIEKITGPLFHRPDIGKASYTQTKVDMMNEVLG